MLSGNYEYIQQLRNNQMMGNEKINMKKENTTFYAFIV
jgi:hypothetical protein